MPKPIITKQMRMGMWLDKILANISRIENVFDRQDLDYVALRKEVIEQYRLINLLGATMKGRTILKGVSIVPK
jgi:hypothetical protein